MLGENKDKNETIKIHQPKSKKKLTQKLLFIKMVHSRSDASKWTRVENYHWRCKRGGRRRETTSNSAYHLNNKYP